MPEELLTCFDHLVHTRGYSNRSEAVRDLVRRELVEQAWEQKTGTAIGILTLIYDHQSSVGDTLTKTQHMHHEVVVCATHIHLNEHRCMEVVVLRGDVSLVKEIADHLGSTRGVCYSRLTAAHMDLEQDRSKEDVHAHS